MKKMIVSDFIEHIITFDNVSSILDICQTQSEKGFIYERLWDICIKFGFCMNFPKPDFINMFGNMNNGKLKKLTTFTKYLNEKVVSSKSSGCSDISLFNTNEESFVFISSKYPKRKCDITKQKLVSYYDIQDIISVTDHNKQIYTKFKIYLLVPDKNSVLAKVKNANKTSEYITKYMEEQNILDEKDLNKCFLHFKADIIKNKINNVINYDIYTSNKTNLCLRFHQELITQKTSSLIEEGQKRFLWGCKCRSGKTYMVGGLIIKQFDIKQKLNVLILTPAPKETVPQFTDDLFNKFKEFGIFKIHHIGCFSDINKIEVSNNNIFVISKQLLGNYINDKTIMKIKSLKLDIIGFDENHFGGTTDISKSIIDSYSYKNTIKIYLTATYNKPLHEWKIPIECQMFWDIEDEQICKSILVDETNIDRLKEKHGETCIISTVNYFINKGLTISDIFKPYQNMPDLHLITTMFDRQRYEIIKENIMGSKYGFCFDVLFALNKQKTKFEYETEVNTILRFISGSNKEIDFKNGDNSMFSRITKICSDKETRKPFTQIWFLPSDNINEISKCLEKLMKEDKILRKYNVMCINSNNKDLAKDIKEEIAKHEKIAKVECKEGLILLAGNMLSLGITLNMCDVVALMNNTLSSDRVLQQMYRCMTEGVQKKYGFVVDLNISRVLNTCVNYTIYKKDKSVEDKIKYLIENHLINIDVDMIEQRNLNSNTVIKKLMDIWKEDPINSFRTLLRKLDNDYEEFDNSTQKLINKTFTKSLKDNKIGLGVSVKDEDDEKQDLPTGKNRVRKDSSSESDKISDDEKEKEKEEIHVIFTKDVLYHLIPLTCLLTLKNSNMDFVKMLNDIKENPELLDTFDDQCLIWWNKKDLIDLIKEIISRYFDKNSNTYNISIQFKMSLQSLIDNPKELLELISDCLKPKVIEKKTFGEVFTPMDFINDKMLKDIEEYWMKKHNENIWTNEKLTWYDPATGMGNYPIAIYYKLMEGLKTKIPNEVERKKHIIEKQLYMGELNKKNCFVIKQIFNINNEYKLNLYEGDTLNIKINKVFGKSKFDIIIGNPPYNEEFKGNNGYAPPLFNKFTEYYMKKCKILSFIIPSRWFVGGKGLDKFLIFMTNRNDIVYIKNYINSQDIFGSSVIIKGGVNYFLKDDDYNDKCLFNNSYIELKKYDIIVDNKYISIINKILGYNSITDLYHSKGYYGVSLTDKRLSSEKKDNYITCYVSQIKGFINYIDKNTLDENKLNNYKVITVTASTANNDCFGNMFIGNMDDIHSESYISFNVNSKSEAESLLSYLKTRFSNFLLKLRKVTHNISSSTCKWIPLPPLNKVWNNEEVYKYFNLTEDEKKLIKETKISGYNDVKPIDVNEPKIIKDGKKQYYLIDNKLYKVKKDKTQGDLFGSYKDGKIIEGIEEITHIKDKNEMKEII